jgi:hypothetical protein
MGVDLGQSRDPSAIVVVEYTAHDVIEELPEETALLYQGGQQVGTKTVTPTRRSMEAHYHVAHIARSALGTPYPVTVEQVAALSQRFAPHWTVFDRSGVGRPVGDLLLDAYRDGRIAGRRPYGLTIVGGEHSGAESVTKADLVAGIVRALQQRRLHVDPALPGADKLIQELRDFRVRITDRGRDTFGAVTESAHDDLVVALGLAILPWNRWRGQVVDGSRVVKEHRLAEGASR